MPAGPAPPRAPATTSCVVGSGAQSGDAAAMRCTVIMAVPDGASTLASWCSSITSAVSKNGAASSAKRIISTAPMAKFGATRQLLAENALAPGRRGRRRVKPVVPITAWTPWAGAPARRSRERRRATVKSTATSAPASASASASGRDRRRPRRPRRRGPDRRRPRARARGRRRRRRTPSPPCGRRRRTPLRGSSRRNVATRPQRPGGLTSSPTGRRAAGRVPGSPHALRHQHPERRSGRRPARAGPARPRPRAGTALFVWDHLHLDRQQLLPTSTTRGCCSAPWRPTTDRLRLGPLVTPARPPPARGCWPSRSSPSTTSPRAGPWSASASATRRRRVRRLRRPHRRPASGPTLLDEGLAVITACWTGDPVDHDGARFRDRRRSSCRCPSSSRGRRSGWRACGPTAARWSGPPATTASCRCRQRRRADDARGAGEGGGRHRAARRLRRGGHGRAATTSRCRSTPTPAPRGSCGRPGRATATSTSCGPCSSGPACDGTRRDAPATSRAWLGRADSRGHAHRRARLLRDRPDDGERAWAGSAPARSPRRRPLVDGPVVLDLVLDAADLAEAGELGAEAGHAAAGVLEAEQVRAGQVALATVQLVVGEAVGDQLASARRRSDRAPRATWAGAVPA